MYEHPDVINQMLDHLCSPQMSDIFVRLLNFNTRVFQKKDDEELTTASSNLEASSSAKASLSEVAA